MNKRNEILLRRRWKLELGESSEETLPLAFVATASANLKTLGFIFGPDLIEASRKMTPVGFQSWYEGIRNYLAKMVGKVSLDPMYPNFPNQVMEADGVELWMNAMIHYFGDLAGYRWLPNYEKKERKELNESERNLRVIRLADPNDFTDIAKAILASKSSLSEQDKDDLRFFIKENAENLNAILPESFSHKENFVLIACEFLKATGSIAPLEIHFKGATDVLRMAVAMSEGDISLAKGTKFRSFKRAERRMLLALLEKLKSIEEDMVRYERRWVRLGERIHPGEYAKKFPKAAKAFDTIRNNPKTIETFNRRIEKVLKAGNAEEVLRLLEKRPGEFARRLDHILRTSDKVNAVLEGFERVVDHVSTRVLLQMTAHFEMRADDVLCRLFFPKGNVGKLFSREDKRLPIASEICEKVVEIANASLVKRFSEEAPLGKVFIAPELENYSVPMSQRSASKALKTVARGSRLILSNDKEDSELQTLRFFLWWKEGKKTGRIDVDLSAVFYSADWEFKAHISYTNLRNKELKTAHSGDITSAPHGACEYIDVDLPSAELADCRYVVMNVYSYSKHNFVDMPECFAGWMMRGEPQGGEVFEASTVQQRFDLAAESRIAVPVVFDLKERVAIWCDLALSRNIGFRNNLEANERGVANLAYAMANHRIPNLSNLFHLHAKARGEIVNSVEEADTVFSLSEGVRPEDSEIIMSEYL